MPDAPSGRMARMTEDLSDKDKAGAKSEAKPVVVGQEVARMVGFRNFMMTVDGNYVPKAPAANDC